MEEKALVAILADNTNVTALIGLRVYPVYPQEEPTYPFAVYTRINTEPLNDLDGRVRPFRNDIQIEVWADDYGPLKDIQNAIFDALDQYRGTIAGVVIQLVESGDMQDGQDEMNQKYMGTQLFSIYA